MPVYSCHCSTCSKDYTVTLEVSKRNEPTVCPGCGAQGQHRSMCAGQVGIIVQGGSRQTGLSWRFGWAMRKAKQERAAHKEKFGAYKEYLPDRRSTAEARVYQDEEVTHLGNIKGEVADRIHDEMVDGA